MEKNKKYKINFSILIMFLMLCFSSVYSSQQTLLNYEFEEGTGSIVFDLSGNDNHGSISSANYITNSKFGTYAMDFDGGNDYITTISTSEIPEIISLSTYINVLSNQLDVFATIYDTTDNLRLFIDRDATNKFEIRYIDTNGIERIRQIQYSGTILQNNWYHIYFEFNTISNSYKIKLDNNLVEEGVFSYIPSTISPNNIFRLGADKNGDFDFNGILDSVRLFNFALNDSQINELITTNTITYVVDPTIEPETETGDLINKTTPIKNSIQPTITKFDLVLNERVDLCEFYIDNNFVYSFENTFGVSFTENLEVGEHTYFYYCEVLNINETKIQQLTNVIPFTVEASPTEIIFEIVGVDFTASEQDFYITTPCPVVGFSAIGYESGYQARYNQNGIQWNKITNGVATVNTTAGLHEFCLFNGRVIVNEPGVTTNYNVQTKEGLVELGTIEIPNVENSYIKLSLDEFEVFDKTNPKAWGETWASIITGLILFAIGSIILFIAAKSNSSAGVVIGAIMIMAALGFEINGVIGILVGI